MVGATAHISEAWLIPVLEGMLARAARGVSTSADERSGVMPIAIPG